MQLRALQALSGIVIGAAALSGCSGATESTDEPSASSSESGPVELGAASCEPKKGEGVRFLLDDRAALPTQKFVSVARAGGDALSAVDEANANLRLASLRALVAQTGDDRDASVDAAVESLKGKASGDVRIVVLKKHRGVGEYYEAALDKLGANGEISYVDGAEAALKQVKSKNADVAALPVDQLAEGLKVDLPTGEGIDDQMRAVSGGAREAKLEMGGTSGGTLGSVVAVGSEVAGQDVTTLTQLGEACGAITLSPAPLAQEATDALAETYGFEAGDASPENNPPKLTGGDKVAIVLSPVGEDEEKAKKE